jgi:tripartite-type tricarboxylate transporter receptor subunit TctC
MRKPSRRQLLRCAAASLVTPLAHRFARAQTWPSKSIRAIVPLAPGTGVDILARLVLNELSLQLGQTIVIDNRPGAGGTIGEAVAAKAEPDGYTILAESSTHTVLPYTYAHLAYDPSRDFAPVAHLGAMPLVLACAPLKGMKSIDELVSAARSRPGALSYASGGTGTTTHLVVERLQLSARFQALHVPFRGAAYSADLLSGRIDFAYGPLGAILEFLRDGRLVALAVSSRKRATVLPDTPTTLEAGYANSDFNFYVGMFAPANTPRDIIEKLNRDTTIVLGAASMREMLARIGAEPMLMTIREFNSFIGEDFASNEALIKSIGLKPL